MYVPHCDHKLTKPLSHTKAPLFPRVTHSLIWHFRNVATVHIIRRRMSIVPLYSVIPTIVRLVNWGNVVSRHVCLAYQQTLLLQESIYMISKSGI